jgi:hypothetical protein
MREMSSGVAEKSDDERYSKYGRIRFVTDNVRPAAVVLL